MLVASDPTRAADLAAALRTALPDGRVLTGDAISDDYAHDEALTVAAVRPAVVVRPGSPSSITSTPAWRALAAHTATPLPHLRELFAADPQRFARFSVGFDGWLLDYSKQRVNSETMSLLGALWLAADGQGWIGRMRNGEAINHTEGRAVGHTWLRAPHPRPAKRGPDSTHLGHP